MSSWPSLGTTQRDDRSVVFFPPAHLPRRPPREAVRPARSDVSGSPCRTATGRTGGAFTGEVVGDAAATPARSWCWSATASAAGLWRDDGRDGEEGRAVLDGGLVPVLCVGEKIEDRRAGRATSSSRASSRRCSRRSRWTRRARWWSPTSRCGPSAPASTRPRTRGSDARRFVRGELAARYGHETADGVPVLYGGSVKADNAAALLSVPGVDGVLVGGASLDPHGFAKICGAV